MQTALLTQKPLPIWTEEIVNHCFNIPICLRKFIVRFQSKLFRTCTDRRTRAHMRRVRFMAHKEAYTQQCLMLIIKFSLRGERKIFHLNCTNNTQFDWSVG